MGRIFLFPWSFLFVIAEWSKIDLNGGGDIQNHAALVNFL